MYQLKTIPEDFIVEEIPNRTWLQEGPFLVVKLKKREWNTEDAVQAIANILKIPRKHINYAGTKDRHALTTQYISIKDLKNVNITLKDITVEKVGFTNEPLALAELKGNKFKITVRNLEKPLKEKRFIPNFFDKQRFGKQNDSIGKHITKKEFKQACDLILQEDSYHSKRLQSTLNQQPHNVIGALRNLPKKTLLLYIRAYQSRLFNLLLEQQLKDKTAEQLKDKQLPIMGFDLSEEDKKLYKNIKQQEHVQENDFIIRSIPELSMEGTKRQAIIELTDLKLHDLQPDELTKDKQKQLVEFSLPKGAYATNVIKYLME